MTVKAMVTNITPEFANLFMGDLKRKALEVLISPSTNPIFGGATLAISS